jgi:pimeloyl-ACP methyl ester carboxylesterase
MSSALASQIHLRTPPEPGKKSASRTYIIYFLTGNPGLVEYYRTFLTHLYGLLSRDTASDRDVEFQVYSRSLSGFEMDSADIKTMKWRKEPPYGLQDQIWHSEDSLTDLVEEVKEQGAKDVRVILVGHSVGAYISLEVIRRLRAQGMAGDDFETRVVGAVGLFPTVVDIARSESGIKAAVSRHMLWRFRIRANRVTAFPQELELRNFCSVVRQLHNVSVANLAISDAHSEVHELPFRCSTHHSLLRKIAPWYSTSAPHGARRDVPNRHLHLGRRNLGRVDLGASNAA